MGRKGDEFLVVLVPGYRDEVVKGAGDADILVEKLVVICSHTLAHLHRDLYLRLTRPSASAGNSPSGGNTN